MANFNIGKKRYETEQNKLRDYIDYVVHKADARLQSEIDTKVDKVKDKGLSSNDYTGEEKEKLSGIEANAQVNTVTSVAGKTGAVTLGKADVGLENVNNTSDMEKPVSTATQTALNGKVDKEAGKGLSSNDYTGGDKARVENAEQIANKNQPNGYAGLDGDGYIPYGRLKDMNVSQGSITIGPGTASNTVGVAIGDNAGAGDGGGAIGMDTYTKDGGSVGYGAWSYSGGAVGLGALAGDGFSGGRAAKVADTDGLGIDAIQLGTGTNNTSKSLQVYDKQLLTADGLIPEERMDPRAGTYTTTGMTDTLTVDTKRNVTTVSDTIDLMLPSGAPEGWDVTITAQGNLAIYEGSWSDAIYTMSSNETAYLVRVGGAWYKTEESAMPATVGYAQAMAAPLNSRVTELEGYVGYEEEDIYGISVDFENKTFERLSGAEGKTAGADFDDILCFGGRRRCNVADDGTVNAYYGEEGYTEDGTNGQVMVEQPAFYYRVVPLVVEPAEKGGLLRKARYYISPAAKSGFKLHPAFISGGRELEHIYLSAYEGCVWSASQNAYILDDATPASFSTDKLSSVAGAKPASGANQVLTRANSRKLSHNRGSGWEQAYIATISASQLLMLVEYAGFNMQQAIGNGSVNKTDDKATSMAENTGATASLGNASGTAENSNGIQFVSYRGEENFWGNIWGWVDGINNRVDATGGTPKVYISDHGFADNTANTPYKEVPVSPTTKDGFISAFCYCEEFDWLFLPGETVGNSSLPVGDYLFGATTTSWYGVRLGGAWYGGYNNGAYCFNVGSPSSHRERFIGTRLVYVPGEV